MRLRQQEEQDAYDSMRSESESKSESERERESESESESERESESESERETELWSERRIGRAPTDEHNGVRGCMHTGRTYSTE